MTDNDPPFLVCLPTKLSPKPPESLAVKRLCCRCQAQVWVAPSGAAIQRKEATALLCIPCWSADKSLSSLEAQPLNAAQQKEIADATGAPVSEAEIKEITNAMRAEDF